MIKMVAIDLDGTLLDDDKKYDKKRFKQLAKNENKKDHHIVIATGNQYIKAVQFFEDFKNELIFITDNGSTIHIGETLHYSQTLEIEEYKTFIQQLPESLIDKMVISSHDHALMSDGEHTESFMEAANKHYPILKKESNLATIDIPIVKITLKFDEDDAINVEQIESILPDDWRMTSSGFGFYDIILNSVSKLTGIKQLQDLYNIEDSEIAAFGDSNNDLELLEGLPNSYAMENGTDKVKQASRYIIGNNNDNAVIDTLEEILN